MAYSGVIDRARKMNSLRGANMQCPHCTSDTQTELTAEINIHFTGLRNLESPGVLIFPTLVVCLDCGLSWFTVPHDELAVVALCAPKSNASTGSAGVRTVALRRSTGV